MKLRSRYNTLACVTALLAAMAYVVADEGTFLLGVLSIAACALAWLTSRSGRPWALPRWVVNLFMIVAIFDAAARVLSPESFSGYWTGGANTPIVSILSHFLVYILLIKLFDRRGSRDEAHIVSLSVFVVVGAILTSNSLTVGILILLFTPSVIACSMLMQLVAGALAVEDQARRQDLEAIDALSIPPVSVRRFRRDLLASASLATVGTVVLATIVFLLMPRGLWNGLLGRFGKVSEGTSVGFTDQITLGGGGFLRDDRAEVMTVKVTDLRGQQMADVRGMLHLRAAIKNRYVRSKATWVAEPSGATGSDGISSGPDEPIRLGNPEFGQIKVRMEVSLRRPLPESAAYFFTIWRPLKFWTDQPVVLAPPGPDRVLRSAASAAEVRGYSVECAMEYRDERDTGRDDVSFDSPEIHRIATEVLSSRALPLDPAQRDAAMNRRVAGAIMEYLRDRCTYSTIMTAPDPGEDPIEMFLNRTRSGHCEYFASAMVALCQSVGLDARLVAGYLATEFNSTTGEYIVRESNAHAWTEVRLAPGRWQTYDPSPPDALERIHRPSSGILSSLRHWYESLNATWSSAFISYDGKRQQRLIGATTGWAEWYQRLGGWLTSVASRFRVIRNVLQIVMVLLVALVVLFIGRRALRAMKWARRTPVDSASALAADPALERLLTQVGFYDRGLQLLRNADLEKPSYRPPGIHARVLEASAGRDISAVVRDLAHWFYKVRFGRRPLSARELAEAEAAVVTLEDLLHARSSRLHSDR